MASPTEKARADHKLDVPAVAKAEPGQADRTGRAQWLRAAILGANDGLLSTASLILGVGAAKDAEQRTMVLSGVAGAVAGACSMALGEFVSVSTQRDIEEILNIRDQKPEQEEQVVLPNPVKAAVASGFAFLMGSVVPLLATTFIIDGRWRMMAVVAVTSLALAVFGGGGAYLGGSRVAVSAVRVLTGGWIAMGVTYFLLKNFNKDD
ncbi:hypothetical protein QJS04_geneDACA001442 [Acorus gramineus]|uniref:Vacuolar iron transporter n=1 Tax=Acorus gramineus TaxID=55184 RepID=A0AAV9A6B7_ACOGR|nr:hypothetical protein QJS04_geneDACA001442 [Acorus gramineus]